MDNNYTNTFMKCLNIFSIFFMVLLGILWTLVMIPVYLGTAAFYLISGLSRPYE